MLISRCQPRHEIDRLFKGLDFPGFSDFFETEAGNGGRTALRIPKTNIRETETEFVFTIEMPGIDKSQIGVSIEGDRLQIKGATGEETEEKGLIRREFRSGNFERSFGVGTDVDTDKVKARMTNGVLTVTLPKKSERVGRKVDVA